MSTVVRVPERTREQLAELAQQFDLPLAQVLAQAVDRLWREQWVEAANVEYATWMRDHADEYAAHRAEMARWDRTLADGLTGDDRADE